jgi:ribosomal protein L28
VRDSDNLLTAAAQVPATGNRGLIPRGITWAEMLAVPIWAFCMPARLRPFRAQLAELEDVGECQGWRLCEAMRDAARVAVRVPLTTLLSRAWIAFAMEADNAVEAAGSERVGRLFRISMSMWANGLRFVDEEGITVGELQARARAACNIGGLERWGWITVDDAGAGRRDGYGSHRGVTSGTVLRPTRAGVYARRLWPLVVTGIEQRWRTRFGTGAVDSLREALLPLAGQMPSSLPEVHASDGFYTRAIKGMAPEEDASLAALLGQALTALTLEHEQGSKVSLPIAANVLRVIDGEVVRIRDLPRLSGVSKEAIAMAARYLSGKGLAELRPERSITLSAAGRDALADCRARAARRRHQALQAFLEAILSQREALAKGLVPPPGCWRGEKPYLTQTQRVLADPAAALPWQPMVLHRGGWPDGS